MLPYLVVVALIALLFVWPAWRSFRREEEEARVLLAKAVAAGQQEPSTLRPYVDPGRCMGSGACVTACPEGVILKVIDGRATVVNASACVGHGACVDACPMSALRLRFGSERRGVDLPEVGPDFQTNVPGIYIAGELGGMGLVANAARQGSEAVEYLARGLPRREGDALDLIVVGAGPAGIAASLTARQKGLAHVVLEQDALGGSILHYPRHKVVMSHGLQLPGRPPVRASTIQKEDLVALLVDAVREAGLPVAEHERVEAVGLGPDGLLHVRTSTRTLRAARVLLAVGRRGTPRTLGVPGEELPKVAYRLLDPELVQHSHVLVVGGGDSALEAACALAEQPGNRVSLSYRGTNFARAKLGNVGRLQEAADAGRVQLLLGTQVTAILPDRVTLDGPEGTVVLPNDRTWVFAGGVLPTAFLRDTGVALHRHHGDRVVDLDATDPG